MILIGHLSASQCLVVSDSLLCPWTAARQAPLSMGFLRQEYWSELPFPPSGDLPDPGINPHFLHCRQTLYPLSRLGSPFILIINPIWCRIIIVLLQVNESGFRCAKKLDDKARK